MGRRLNPRIHIICGMCGCDNMMTFRINQELNDDTDIMEDKCTIVCKNCKSLTGLAEIIEQEIK